LVLSLLVGSACDDGETGTGTGTAAATGTAAGTATAAATGTAAGTSTAAGTGVGTGVCNKRYWCKCDCGSESQIDYVEDVPCVDILEGQQCFPSGFGGQAGGGGGHIGGDGGHVGGGGAHVGGEGPGGAGGAAGAENTYYYENCVPAGMTC